MNGLPSRAIVKKIRPDGRITTVLGQVGTRLEELERESRERARVAAGVCYRVFVCGDSYRTAAAWCRDKGWYLSPAQVRGVVERAREDGLGAGAGASVEPGESVSSKKSGQGA